MKLGGPDRAMRTMVSAVGCVVILLARAVGSALLLLALGCAPRADRRVLMMERARTLTSAFEGAWIQGLQESGEQLFHGRGGCSTCHRIGENGTRFTGPNLGVDPLCATDAKMLTERDAVACRPVAERAAARRPGLSPIEYVVESIMDPERVVTPTYAPKVMKRLDEPPVSLSDEEILALATYVAGGAGPNSMRGLVAARGFMGPCREARDSRTGTPSIP